MNKQRVANTHMMALVTHLLSTGGEISFEVCSEECHAGVLGDCGS